MDKVRRDGLNRRQALRALSLAAGGGLVVGAAGTREAKSENTQSKPRYRYCLNTSTIRGQDLPLEKEVALAAEAGYDAIEPWIRELREVAQRDPGLKALRRQIEEHGLTVESAIGFARWIVDDAGARKKGFEEAEQDMELLAQIGGKRIAAPPAGASWDEPIDLNAVAARYHDLLQLGERIGVVPQVELWGGNATIGRLSQAVAIAIESGHPDACFLGDVYHCYKGGSDFDGLRLLGPQALQVFHFNDYPDDPPREKIGDRDRVYPGDGVAPIPKILNIFEQVGASPVLSLELFNPVYWKEDARVVVKTGLRKMKRQVEGAA